ncbi:hypothetical protein [Desertimonas flava]|uniref:hypothetical protein n=1 Tax=Desertimonas flava TaxID=2064846 RepID=UPI000E34DF45|nr:hypothetical protein [Desertimonas flava]
MSRRHHFRHSRLAITAALALAGAARASTTLAAAGVPPGLPRTPTEAFDERRDRYLQAMMTGPQQHFDHDAAVGLLLLEHADRTGSRESVARANELILSSLRRLDLSDANDEFSAQHGGAFSFINAVLRFGGQPDLLYPETFDAVVRGEYPDGTVDTDHSLIAFRDQFFGAAYSAQGVGLDVRSGQPWDPAGPGGYNGTENHKLQSLVTGMLLSEIYADDVVNGVPVRDDTPALDDQWHYYRDAFFRYSAEWNDGSVDHVRRDVAQTEDDSIQYLPTYLGDYWLLRDLYSDPAVRAQAETFIDRLLADWSEDLVGPLHTGPTERVYDIELSEGLSFQEHALNYLLFDNLGGSFRTESDELFDFGGWANIAVATSDYVPGSPDFPMVLVDLATDKGDGYTVREGGSDHNWVESDLALGFRLDGRVFNEDLPGGFQVVAEGGGPLAGRMVTVFHGPTPFSKEKPTITPMGVQSGRTALLRAEAGGTPQRIWVHPDFASVVTDDRWLFLAQPSWSGRTVYAAIGAAGGSIRSAGTVDGGEVFEIETWDTMVWEVATSDDVASFDAFREAVAGGRLTFDEGLTDFVSPFTGTELHLEPDPANRTVDGVPVDWGQYDYSFSSPWGSHAYGNTSAIVSGNGQSAEWNWDPDGTGSEEQTPVKSVVNRNE